jgi:hypothetical protein
MEHLHRNWFELELENPSIVSRLRLYIEFQDGHVEGASMRSSNAGEYILKRDTHLVISFESSKLELIDTNISRVSPEMTSARGVVYCFDPVKTSTIRLEFGKDSNVKYIRGIEVYGATRRGRSIRVGDLLTVHASPSRTPCETPFSFPSYDLMIYAVNNAAKEFGDTVQSGDTIWLRSERTMRWLHCDVNEEGDGVSSGCHFNGTCIGVSSKGSESGQSLMNLKGSCAAEEFRIWAEGTSEGDVISSSHRIWLQNAGSSKWVRMNDVLNNVNTYPPIGMSPFQLSANGRTSCYKDEIVGEKIGNPVIDVVSGVARTNPLCARHRMRFHPFSVPQHRVKDGVYILEWSSSSSKNRDWKCVYFPEEAADDVIDRGGPTISKSKCRGVPIVKRSSKTAPMVSPSPDNKDDELTFAFRIQWLQGDTYLIQAPRRSIKGEWMCLGYRPGSTVPVDAPHAVRLMYHWPDETSTGFDESKQFSLSTEICGLNFRDGQRPHNLNSALNQIYERNEVVWRIRRVTPFEFTLESLEISKKFKTTKWRRVGFDKKGAMIREERRHKRSPGRFRLIPVDTRFEGNIGIGPDSPGGGGGGGGGHGTSGTSSEVGDGGASMLPMGLRRRRAAYERLLRQKDSPNCASSRCKQDIDIAIAAIHNGVVQ